MIIRFHYRNISFRVKSANDVRRWLGAVAVSESSSELSVDFVFTDSDTMLQLNREFLEHDYHTDVITFDYRDNNVTHGEVYIGVETVRDNARFFKVGFRSEILRVMVHGLLHLAGYGDGDEAGKRVMRDKENYYLEKYSNGEF